MACSIDEFSQLQRPFKGMRAHLVINGRVVADVPVAPQDRFNITFPGYALQQHARKPNAVVDVLLSNGETESFLVLARVVE